MTRAKAKKLWVDSCSYAARQQLAPSEETDQQIVRWALRNGITGSIPELRMWRSLQHARSQAIDDRIEERMAKREALPPIGTRLMARIIGWFL